MQNEKIDSHQHFWKYNPEEYSWIDESMDMLRKDFLPEKLKKTIEDTDISGTIAVQARQSIEETKWLLGLAEENDFIKGVVGFLPLTEEKVEKEMAQMSSISKLKGLRHVVQDEAPGFLSGEDFNRGVSLMKKYNLVYDILIYARQLPEAIEFADRHPLQKFVVDHIAKPEIKTGNISVWRKDMKLLSERENVFCKISGMVTEADWKRWRESDLKPYFETVLECFGAKRLMFGSDWPACLAASPYRKWLDTVKSFIKDLSEDEKSSIMGMTAKKIYNL